jgi:hypothetical protein
MGEDMKIIQCSGLLLMLTLCLGSPFSNAALLEDELGPIFSIEGSSFRTVQIEAGCGSWGYQGTVMSAEKNSQKNADLLCSGRAKQVSKFKHESKCKYVHGSLAEEHYKESVIATASFRCISSGANEGYCDLGEKLCRTNWGSIPYCAVKCDPSL